VAVVLGGGYAPNIDDTVEIHLNTVRVVNRLLKDVQKSNLSGIMGYGPAGNR
jgi:hypothetical protein